MRCSTFTSALFVAAMAAPSLARPLDTRTDQDLSMVEREVLDALAAREYYRDSVYARAAQSPLSRRSSPPRTPPHSPMSLASSDGRRGERSNAPSPSTRHGSPSSHGSPDPHRNDRSNAPSPSTRNGSPSSRGSSSPSWPPSSHGSSSSPWPPSSPGSSAGGSHRSNRSAAPSPPSHANSPGGSPGGSPPSSHGSWSPPHGSSTSPSSHSSGYSSSSRSSRSSSSRSSANHRRSEAYGLMQRNLARSAARELIARMVEEMEADELD